MPSISQADLEYYAALERGVYSLQYCLIDCRCSSSKFCDHKYMLRRLTNELAANIEIHRAQSLVRYLPKDPEIKKLSSANPPPDLRAINPVQGDTWHSDWGKSSGSMNLPGPETP